VVSRDGLTDRTAFVHFRNCRSDSCYHRPDHRCRTDSGISARL